MAESVANNCKVGLKCFMWNGKSRLLLILDRNWMAIKNVFLESNLWQKSILYFSSGNIFNWLWFLFISVQRNYPFNTIQLLEFSIKWKISGTYTLTKVIFGFIAKMEGSYFLNFFFEFSLVEQNSIKGNNWHILLRYWRCEETKVYLQGK